MTKGCANHVLSDWLYNNYKDVWIYKWECGFCERWDMDCVNCELGIKQGGFCAEIGSNFKRWNAAKRKNTRIKYATLIYNDIKSLKEGKA